MTTVLATGVVSLLSVATVLGSGAADAATTNDVSLTVASARTEPRALGGAGVDQGDAVTEFKWLINVDNTGTTEQRSPAPGSGCSPADAGYPGSCAWPSILEIPEPSAVLAQGDQTDFAGGATLNLPDDRYVISVLADGYKIDGAHFTVPMEEPGEVQVELQPDPLPDSTVKGQVFADMAPTNGTLDVGDQPLAGFEGHLADTLGEVSTDIYGNPLCTTYQGEDPATHQIPLAALDDDMLPVVDVKGGGCLSDADGIVTIPHVGPNRYTLSVTAPDGETWIQTTTLEGNHDWDTWVMEGATGLDTEFTLAGEPVPQPIFGFASPTHDGQPLDSSASAHITGTVVGINTYTPPKGGAFDFWGGNTGTKVKHPIKRPWLSLADLENGDQAVWVGRGNADGSFDISGVPNGTYSLSWWDEPQDYNLNFIQVTIADGQTEHMGNVPLNGWWTEYEGYVFDDTNRNGVKDPGEQGISGFPLTLRKQDNSLMDRGQNTAVTDADGHYFFEAAYPLGSWLVLEAYSDSVYTTGITYQADNQPDPTTIKGAGVDVSVMPIIGLGGRVDWGVHAYDPGPNRDGGDGPDPSNGGIVGTVSYDTTRNELDPRYAAAEDWQPGVSDVPVELYGTVLCEDAPDNPCETETDLALDSDGSYLKGTLLNSYLTEHWSRPTGCTARDVDGNPLVHGADEDVLATDQETTGECISSFMQGVQVGAYESDQGTPDANFGASVDGNYGFGDGCFTGTLDDTDPENPVCNGGDFETLPAGDYLVEIGIADDDVTGNPLYQVTQEEDINIANGDQVVPQVPPPACAGPLHTVDLAGTTDPDTGDPTDGYPAAAAPHPTFNGGTADVTVPASTPQENAPFLDMGGTPYEGSAKPGCQTKLVELNNGKSIVPVFNVFTDVPVASRLRGLIVDDINFSTDPRSVMYGEKAGVPSVPVGIYDFTNRLVTTLESDFNGIYDVLLPSTNIISCPTPSGVCANMYRFVANDPGIPGRLNSNWNPRYRTIATEFEALPGVTIPTDLAPTQVGLKVESPATGQRIDVSCPIAGATPQLFAVTRPYTDRTDPLDDQSFAIEGTGFGADPGTVTLDGAEVDVSSWSPTHIDATVPATVPAGPHQLEITGSNGVTTTNGLTFHVLGSGYTPRVLEVGPSGTGTTYDYASIQPALNFARSRPQDRFLVIVYPGVPDLANPRNNPRGAYYENLVMASPVKLQGVGPGGFQGNQFVPGSIIDAGAFGGDTDLATAWYALVGSLTWDGNQNVNDGEAIYVLASNNQANGNGRARQFTAGYRASIDGFDIRGGDQQGFPGNINDLTGAPTGLPPGIVTQGGAIFANAYARYLRITNNVVDNNGAGYGTIRIGTPDLQGQQTNQHNENVAITDNRIVQNAGTNLAGAIGIFAGADNYEVARNDICGNFSMEYGGGLSVYGRSPNGRIHHNRIYFNESNDEGGGIMVAGALPADPSQLSTGTGPVDIRANLVQANLANDDGGGIRFLMAGGTGATDPMDVVNNTIVNNVSTHEGGGIALDDAPHVRIVNNTIMRNLTTATAVTSNGAAAPAGISTTSNSDQMQVTLPNGAPTFSNPVLFNNILWDNRAGSRQGTTVSGLGNGGGAVDNWDLGVSDGTGELAPTNSVVQQDPGQHAYTDDPSNAHADPQVVEPYDLLVSFATWRQNPAFVDSTLVALEAPVDQLGDYHLGGCGSPACDLGAADDGNGVAAPSTDIDDERRPNPGGGFDAGSDEYGSIPAPPPPGPNATELMYSTLGGTNPQGVTGPADDADIYRWDGAAHSRNLDLTAAPYSLPGNANVDGYSRASASQFFVSFASNVTMPVSSGLGQVQDEDVLFWDGTAWKLALDGTGVGLTSNNLDIDALSVSWPMIYFSTAGSSSPPGVGGQADDADVYRYDASPQVTGPRFARVWDASAAGLAGGANVDGLDWLAADDLHVSFSSTTTAVPGLGDVADEAVVNLQGSQWLVTFDGTGLGGSGNLDIDAFSLADSASPPSSAVAQQLAPFGALTLSTLGGAARLGVHSFDGLTLGQQTDLTAAPYDLPATANVDGIDLGPGETVSLSFARGTRVPGLGTVADEDVVRWDGAGHWELLLDGSRHGLRRPGQDVDALTVSGRMVYFSTLGNVRVRGVRGQPDDADVYLWNGKRFWRVWDASRKGVPGRANVDGLTWAGKNNVYVSFSGKLTRLPGLGPVQDEDVVQRHGPGWAKYFDGTIQGFTTAAADVDAFDVPPTPADLEGGVSNQ